MSTEADHVHSAARTPDTEADKINTAALGTLTFVGLLAMISVTAAVTALVRHDLQVEEAEKASGENRVVTDLKAAQRSTLSGPPGYVDRTKGLVSLPIDLAQGLVVRELSRDPNSATPAAPSKPAAVDSAAAPATLPAPAASAALPAPVAPAPSGAVTAPKNPGDTAKPRPTDTKPAPVSPDPGRSVLKPTPDNSVKPPPAPVPALTPTTAAPAPEKPGPLNK